MKQPDGAIRHHGRIPADHLRSLMEFRSLPVSSLGIEKLPPSRALQARYRVSLMQ
jgi:hypothetical protein